MKKNRRQTLLLLTVILLIPLGILAVRPYKPVTADPLLEPWRWREVEQLDGRGVICMDEASDGTFWFGCIGGVVHYDGYTVTSFMFDPEVIEKLNLSSGNAWVKSVLALDNRSLLAVVDDHLLILSNGSWHVFEASIGVTDNVVRLLKAENGWVWLMTRNKIWKVNPTERSIHRSVFFDDNNRIEDLCLDDRGHFWLVKIKMGESAHLVHIPIEGGMPANPKDWSSYSMPHARFSTEARLISTPQHEIWYADNKSKNGLMIFNVALKTWDTRLDDATKDSHYSLVRLKNGSTLAGCHGRLCLINGKAIHQYNRTKLNLPNLALSSIHEAKDGRIWMIGRIGHVYVVDPEFDQWKTYSGLHFQCESKHGIQWFISSAHSVVSYDPSNETWLEYGADEKLINLPTSITTSSHGYIWVAGSDRGKAGVSVFNGTCWTHLNISNFSTRIGMKSVYEDQDASMWFGAYGGASKSGINQGGALQYHIDKEGRIQFHKRHKGSQFPNQITAFAQTADRKLWLGSQRILRYDLVREEIEKLNDLPLRTKSDLIVDYSGEIWASTKCLGVFHRKGEQWESFSTADGLASDLVFDLLPLADGSVIATHAKGINRFDGKSWSSLLFSKLFSASYVQAETRTSDRDIFWLNLTPESVKNPSPTAINPNRMFTVRYQADKHAPDTQIDQYLAQVSQPGNSHISWSAMDQWENTAVQELQFSWRLNGQEWSPFSSETGKTFLNLSDGRHTLEVRSRDRDFNIDLSPAWIEFTVDAPLWKHGWFITLILALILLSIALIWLWARRQKEYQAYLKEINQIKSSFFTNISHELRTPLTVMLGPLENLLVKENDHSKKSQLSMMLRNVKRMSTLINQLLDFRQLETGGMQIALTSGNISLYVREATASLQSLAELNEVELCVEIPNECHGYFDPDKLEKILTNLVSNAIKFTLPGGSVSLKLFVNATKQLVLIIEDSGPGIGKEYIQHIFERFYRIPESSVIEGSGIGLNLTKELVDLWGGSITAESPIHEENKAPGTRFTVILPINGENGATKVDTVDQDQGDTKNADPELNMQTPLETDSKAPNESPLLLIIEDDADIRSFICNGLESEYRIEEAVNGAEGLVKAKALIPDLVVTDLMMPEMDGIELCRQLKTTLETSHIPVIMLTAKASLEHQVDGLNTGADDYITKPFHMILLQTRIKNLIHSRVMLRERFRSELPPEQAVLPENILDRDFMQNVMRAIEENKMEPEFNSDALAKLLNMSVSTLQRKIKALTNRTPMKLIYELRLKQAASLLKQTSLNITEIAYEVGYEGYPQFFRQFKEQYGVSPKQYRADAPR